MSEGKRTVGMVQLRQISAWSATKIAVFSGIILALAVMALYSVSWWILDHFGVFAKLITTFAPENEEGRAKLADWTSFDTLYPIGLVISAAVGLLVPILTFIFSMLYNVISVFTGGLKFTLMSVDTKPKRSTKAEAKAANHVAGGKRMKAPSPEEKRSQGSELTSPEAPRAVFRSTSAE